jgi:hypothetical protein
MLLLMHSRLSEPFDLQKVVVNTFGHALSARSILLGPLTAPGSPCFGIRRSCRLPIIQLNPSHLKRQFVELDRKMLNYRIRSGGCSCLNCYLYEGFRG